MEYKITYRNNGAIGALLDEYERALADLKRVLSTVKTDELVTIVDTETKDDDCRSIQTILAHVVRSGYGYAIEVRNKQGEKLGDNIKELFEHSKDLEFFHDNIERTNRRMGYDKSLSMKEIYAIGAVLTTIAYCVGKGYIQNSKESQLSR